MWKLKHICLIILFITLAGKAQVQDTAAFKQDSTFSIVWLDTRASTVWASFSMSMYSIDEDVSHYPSRKDSLLARKYRKLIGARPNKHNYRNYSAVASALWDLSRTEEAEKMLLNIYNSTGAYYNRRYYYGSDIPGDRHTNVYGYGSFVSDYKHYACRHLCEINIERKEFEKALHYLHEADTIYPLTYNCGTGYHGYRKTILGLYSICYKGLGQYQTLVDEFLPLCFEYYAGNLVWALQQKYSSSQIDSGLSAALASITCIPDTIPTTYTTIYNSGEPDEKKIEGSYTSGSGTIEIFGVLIDLPRPDLEQNEVVTREHFVREFMASSLYSELAGT